MFLLYHWCKATQSKLRVGCGWLKEKPCVFSGKSVRVLVLTFIPFSKIQTYIKPECFVRPSSLAAVAPNQSWGRIWASSCKLAAFPWHSRPRDVWIFQNGVEFEAKLFYLPAGDSQQGGLCGAWKGRGASSRRVGAESPEAWLPATTIGGPQALSPGGWGGSQRVAFCSVKVPIFFAGQPWSEMSCRLSGRKPASPTPARWVGRLCVDRLSVVDCRKNPVYFLGKVSGC